MNLYFAISILLLFIPLIICLKRQKLASFFDVYDLPDKRKKKHFGKVPLIGGFIFFSYFNIFFILNIIYFSFIPKFISLIFIFYTNIFFFLGFLDDKYKIRPFLKIIFIIVSLSLIYSLFQKFYLSTVYIATIDKLINFGFFFTILCILLLQISINLSDGSNGVVGLYSVFWSIVLIYLNRSFFLNIVLSLFVLNLIIFLLFNFRTKIFLGTAGCNYIAAFFSVISIYLNNNQFIPSEYFVSLFFIPGIDMIRIFLLRLYRKKNIFTFDRNHLHHILVKRFGKFDSLIYLLICVIFFFFSTLFQQKSYLLFLIIFSSIYIIGLNKLCKKK